MSLNNSIADLVFDCVKSSITNILKIVAKGVLTKTTTTIFFKLLKKTKKLIRKTK